MFGSWEMGFFNELEKSKLIEFRIGFGTESKSGFTMEPDWRPVNVRLTSLSCIQEKNRKLLWSDEFTCDEQLQSLALGQFKFLPFREDPLEKEMATHSGMGEPHGLPSMGVHTVGTRLKQLSSSRLLCPWDSPGKKTGVGSHFLLQRIFLTQDSNPLLLCPLHWQADWILYHWPTWVPQSLA